MAYSHFDKFKAFFLALNKSEYHPERMDPKIITPQDKAYCFEWLLKEIPELKGKSNNDLIEFLRDPKKVKTCIAGHFVQKESTELTKTLAEKPAAEEAGGQPAGAETAPTIQETPPPIGSPAGGIPGMGMPAGPAVSPIQRQPRIIIHDIPHAESGMAGGQGAGSAATAKINRLERMEAEKAAAAKPAQTQPKAEVNRAAFQSRFSTAAKNVRNFAARANPFLKTNLQRIGQGLWNMGKLGTGGLYGFGTGTGNRILDSFGGFRSPGGIGGSRSIFGRLGKIRSRGISGAQSLAGKAKSRGMLMFFLAIFGLMFLTGFVAINGAGQTDTMPTGSTGTAFSSSNIASCKFTRGGDPVVEKTFKSPLLLSYVQEASQKANIPQVVLAAFIRVESSSALDMSNDQITNYAANCSESITGALGIMQIQPPGTTSLRGDPASCDDCIDAGAKLIGKTVATMTNADYCDPRTSIIVGAGWILKKMNKLGYGDGTKWNPSWTNNNNAITALVNTYYGGVLYPDYNTGPYNYASDVSTSIQNCKVTAAQPPPPPGSPPAKEFALSCPINNEYNTCSDLFDSRDKCHCAPGFISQSDCVKYPTLQYGIDVGTKASQTAVIPYITYQGETTPQAIACQLIQAEDPKCPATGCESQQILHFRCSSDKITNLYLQYNHIKANTDYGKSIGMVLISGQSVGDVAYYQNGLRRLNIQLGVGGDCSGANTAACKRGGDYFQCPLRKDYNPD